MTNKRSNINILTPLQRKLQNRRYKPQTTNTLHIILILTLLILTINRITKSLNLLKSDLNETRSSISYSILNATFIQVGAKKKVQVKRGQSSKEIILLLLLLSNDVHPNPGPISSVSTHCQTCNEEIKLEDLLECETCKNHYHLTCLTSRSKEALDRSYEWICPSKNCKPNHKEVHNLNTQVSPNRFKPLENETALPDINRTQPTPAHRNKECSGSKASNKSKKVISNDTYDQKLMEELPQISPTEYQGIDLCRGCCKEVKWSQPAISCDKCDQWIHRKCSDMTPRLYKQLTKEVYFKWSCSKCRKDEVMNYEVADITKLSKHELPDEMKNIKTSKNELLILNMNCGSMLNKTEEIQHIINTLDPDVLCLTETWLDSSVPAQGYVPSGYKIIRKDRSDDFKQKYGRNKGGGIAVLFKDHIKIEKKDYLTDDVEEILWVQVKGKKSFMLGIVYRNEYTDLMKENEDGETKIEENVRKASEISDRFVITGDFNIDDSDTSFNLTRKLNNIYSSYNLIQLVKKPTRIDKKSGRPTVIDHVWTNPEKQLINHVNTFIGVSDHLGTYIKLNIKKPEAEETTIRHRSYQKYDPQTFTSNLRENLSQSNIRQHIHNRDVNSAMQELIKILQDTADEVAPMIETKIRDKKNYIPWFTSELRNMITQKNELLQDYYLYGLQSFLTRVKSISNRISHLKRKLKKNYITKKLTEYKDNPKKCWKVIDLITNRQKTHDTVEPEHITQEKANDYNHYFATVGEEIQKKLNLRTHLNNFDGILGFNFIPENEESIKKLIDKIRKDVATGCDDIGARLIKDASEVLSPLLAEIINIGYQTSVFPDCMKTASIKALHKKEDPDKITNYRPISILPTLSKIFERAATDQLVEHLEKNNLLSKHQHAYQRRHSTQTCLVEVINYLYRLIDQKKWTAIASLDLSKAFDSISHSLLLNKLAKLEMSEETLLWIKSYLSNRKQKTKFKNYTSEEMVVTSGVPQGSIIGPLLFLCFTNDIAAVFEGKCKIVSYADDTQLLIDASNLDELIKKIENIITLAQQWYTANSMKNNIGKTEVLIINNKNADLRNIRIKVKDEGKLITIKPQTYIKVLGILIDNQLNWTKQILHVKRKATNSIRNLHRINHLLPTKLKVNLYNSLVVPHFDYADVVWGGCTKTDSQRLQIAQNFAAKSITGNKKYDSASQSLSKLRFLNLQQRRMIHETVYTHKSLLQLNPHNTNTTYLQQRPTSNTRNSTIGKLNLPKHRTTKFQNSPLYRTIKSWNCCPNNLPQNNIKQHKTHLQKHLINTSYNTR